MPRPQFWIQRLALTIDDSSVGLPFPSDDPPWTVTHHFVDSPQLVAGTLKNVRIDLDSASTGDWTFDIKKEGITALTVTIPAGSTTVTNTGSFHFNVLDKLRLTESCTPGASAKPWTLTAEFIPDVAGERAYGGGTINFFGDTLDPALIYKQNPFFPRTVMWGDHTLAEYKTENCLIGQDGSITSFLIYYQIEFLSGEYEYMLWRSTDDGVTFIPQDGSSGTPDTRTYLNASSPKMLDSGGNLRSYCVGSFNMPVLAGDMAFISVQRISGLQYPTDSVGLRGLHTLKFVATDTTRWFISGAGMGLGDVFTNHYSPLGDRTAVEANANLVKINAGPFGVDGAIFNGLIVLLETAPGIGNSRQFTLYDNGVASDIVATISGTDKKGDDDGTALIGTGQSAYVEHIPVGVPDSTSRFWYTFFGTSTAPATNGIIVIKQTIPDGLAQVFDFTASGGNVSPTSFSLSDGQSQSLDLLEDGTYAITEVPISGFLTSYNVSDGSPIDAIVLFDGETVTITVTNVQLGPDGHAEGGNCPDLPVDVASARAGCPAVDSFPISLT